MLQVSESIQYKKGEVLWIRKCTKVNVHLQLIFLKKNAFEQATEENKHFLLF